MRIMKKLIALLAGLILVVLGGIAYASIPSAEGVINGCYKASNPDAGAVIVIDSEESCPSGYTSLNWNQSGPQGEPGVNDLDLSRTLQQYVLAPDQFQTIVAACPSGKTAISGGYAVVNGQTRDVHVYESDPHGDFVGWNIKAHNRGTASAVLVAIAVCSSIPSGE